MANPIHPYPFRRHALALALALAVNPAHAAVMAVDGTQCTLVNAINNANADGDTDGAGGCPSGNGADVLVLKAGKTYLLNTVNNQDLGPNGLPTIASAITINGNGAAIKRSKAAGTPSFRLLRLDSNGNLTLNRVALAGGRLPGNQQYGGAILNGGQLTINDSSITGNSAYDTGGGIASTYRGRLTLNNSTVSGNKARHVGGIVNFPDTTATINNSTVSANIATNGDSAGIGNSGTMTLVNSTVSGNRSQTDWGTGGISNNGSLRLIHSTVSNNVIETGNVAGIDNSGRMTLVNSIVANSKNGADCYTYTNYGGRVVFQGQSIIEDGTCNPPVSGDPKLSPLLDNGGPTLTHALRTGIAINATNTLCRNIDQRQVGRPQPAGGGCDIGAFERVNTIPENFKPLLKFFDAGLANGGIVGVGAYAMHKPKALRNQLLAASSFNPAGACGQLSAVLARLDTDNSPDRNDYVTGDQVAGLRQEINLLRTGLGCQ